MLAEKIYPGCKRTVKKAEKRKKAKIFRKCKRDIEQEVPNKKYHHGYGG